jgi:putative hydroxymethylpyrimidine transport system substrate-binding protein
MKKLTAALTALVLAVTLAACGEKKERTAPAGGLERVNLVLDYVPNPDHAGIYAAMRDGDFRASGLDVKTIVPTDPAAPLKLLASGRADIAISYEPELLLARDRGLDLVAIGALIQRPLTSIMSAGGEKPVRRVSELAHGRVGTAGIPYQDAYLHTVLQHAGVDPSSVTRVNVGFDLVPAMISKRVDATLGAFWNVEGVQLRRAHKHPSIIPIDKAGVPTYDELVFVARARDARTRGEVFRSFLQALSTAHRAVRRDPAKGVDALLAADKNLKRSDTEASVHATLPAFFPTDTSKPFGYMDPRQWAAYARWMLANKLIKQPVSPRALTNEFLPGEGL